MTSTLLGNPLKLLHPMYQRSQFHRSVIEEVRDPQLREAFAFCRNVTKTYARTFYLATRFLPNRKQRGIFAIYALCRYMDNLVDGMEDLVQAEKIQPSELPGIIADWKKKLIETFSGTTYNDPILMAMQHVLLDYSVPLQHPLDLLDGVTQDLSKKSYANFDELYDYCYKVASVVGLMTSEVFGYSDPKALVYAEYLGIAMQLTNILRDVKEDAAMGRIYLPEDEMKQFGVSSEQIFENRLDDKLIALIKFNIDRARRYYTEADKGIALLSRDSRIPVAMARFNYARILDKIEAMEYNVFAGRAKVGGVQKLGALPKAAMFLL
jgi:phytoene synthase